MHFHLYLQQIVPEHLLCSRCWQTAVTKTGKKPPEIQRALPQLTSSCVLCRRDALTVHICVRSSKGEEGRWSVVRGLENKEVADVLHKGSSGKVSLMSGVSAETCRR